MKKQRSKEELGELQFDANFECGNLAEATRISKYEWELRLRPDTFNDRHRLWFYFTVNQVAKEQHVLFSIINFSKGRSSYRDGMTPLVRSRTRPSWQRIPTNNVLYYRIPKRKGYILSFFFKFDRADDE
mgnify:CR=1 FL=1